MQLGHTVAQFFEVDLAAGMKVAAIGIEADVREVDAAQHAPHRVDPDRSADVDDPHVATRRCERDANARRRAIVPRDR